MTHARAPRLADVAAQAQVSEATVSRVLNDKPGVAAKTRQSVLAALDVLGYERPAKLRRASAGLVGLIVPELTNPIFPAFVQALESALVARDLTPVLCSQAPGGLDEAEYIEMLTERGVAGIIFVSGRHADSTADLSRYAALRAAGIALVCINGYQEDIDAPFVSDDDIGAMSQAISFLVDLGHRRIGLAIGPARFVPVLRKVTGFRQAMAQFAGESDVEELISTSLFTVAGGGVAAGPLLDRGCTAIVCGSDLMALGVVREVRRRGLAVPSDVSVVGYDDSPLMAYTDPPLTTVRQDVTAMAEAAVASLAAEIGGTPAPRAELVFRSQFVLRGSTGPMRVAALRPVRGQDSGRSAKLSG